MKINVIYDPHRSPMISGLNYPEFAKALERNGHSVTSQTSADMPFDPPLLLATLTDQLSEADLVVVDMTAQSIDIGILLAFAATKGKRVLALYPQQSVVSRLIVALPNVSVYYYNDTSEAGYIVNHQQA